jgi:hypothetical protein
MKTRPDGVQTSFVVTFTNQFFNKNIILLEMSKSNNSIILQKRVMILRHSNSSKMNCKHIRSFMFQTEIVSFVCSIQFCTILLCKIWDGSRRWVDEVKNDSLAQHLILKLLSVSFNYHFNSVTDNFICQTDRRNYPLISAEWQKDHLTAGMTTPNLYSLSWPRDCMIQNPLNFVGHCVLVRLHGYEILNCVQDLIHCNTHVIKPSLHLSLQSSDFPFSSSFILVEKFWFQLKG